MPICYSFSGIFGRTVKKSCMKKLNGLKFKESYVTSNIGEVLSSEKLRELWRIHTKFRVIENNKLD
jgi:hypothetical protein